MKFKETQPTEHLTEGKLEIDANTHRILMIALGSLLKSKNKDVEPAELKFVIDSLNKVKI